MASADIFGASCSSNSIHSSSYCEIYVEGFDTKALIDSGSGICLISEEFRQQHHILKNRKLNQNLSVKATSVNNQPVELLGSLDIHFSLGSNNFEHSFVVARNISNPVLLGWNFIQSNGLVIDAERGEIRTGNIIIPLLPKWRVFPTVCSAVIKETTIIAPRQEMLIRAKLIPSRKSDVVPDDFEGVLEPDKLSERKNLMIARSISKVENACTLVQVMNVTDVPVTIFEYTPLGTFYAAINQSEQIARIGVYEIVGEVKSDVQSTKVGKPLDTIKTGFNLESTELTFGQKNQVYSMLTDFRDVISSGPDDLGRTTIVDHKIDTGNSVPIKQSPRRIPGNLKEEVDRQTSEMLNNDIIEASHSPWCSPICLVRKKDGTHRFCVDFRRLNSVTHKDAHPLPRIDESIDSLAGSSWFSTLDLASGYWQVGVDPCDREKTAFSSGSGLYQFKVMPFGLTNAPATFQRLMEFVLAGLSWKCCLVYIDDIIVFSKSFEQHMDILRQVLRCLQKAGLKVKPSKCQLFKKEVIFLGYKVSNKGVEPDPSNVAKVGLNLCWQHVAANR